MISVFTTKLDLKMCFTNIRAKKIDGFIFKIFEIVLSYFQIKNKLKKT